MLIYCLNGFICDILNFALVKYRKHRLTSCIFLLKNFTSNQGGCGLSAKTSVHHAVNLHKLTLFIENFTVSIDLYSKIIRTS